MCEATRQPTIILAQPDQGVSYRHRVTEVMGLGGARRVMVYGVTGSGKSSAAARISAATGITWTPVDDLTWEPGWVQVSEDEQRRRFEAICADDTWLLDSAYGTWLDVPLARVELIVALDYPRWFFFQRLLRRTFSRILDKSPICNGNVETCKELFSDDSIILWHFRSFRRKRERIDAWTQSTDLDAPLVLRFTRARDLDRWIDSLAHVGQVS